MTAKDLIKRSMVYFLEELEKALGVEIYPEYDVKEVFRLIDGTLSTYEDLGSSFIGYGTYVGKGEESPIFLFPGQNKIGIKYLLNAGFTPKESIALATLWAEYTERDISLEYKGREVYLIER